MSSGKAKVSDAPNADEKGVMTGVGYVRLPAHDIHELAEFYKATFGMQQIGAFHDHLIMLNVGKTVEEALANPAPRVIVDRRMKSNRGYGVNDNNCWCFMTRGMEHVIRRAEKNGATVVMEPYPIASTTSIVVGKFRDPAGNLIEMTEVGTDTPERLYIGKN